MVEESLITTTTTTTNNNNNNSEFDTSTITTNPIMIPRRRTLFLTGGMSQESKVRRFHRTMNDSSYQKIHIVGQHFDTPKEQKQQQQQQQQHEDNLQSQSQPLFSHSKQQQQQRQRQSQSQNQNVATTGTAAVTTTTTPTTTTNRETYTKDESWTNIFSNAIQYRKWKSIKLSNCHGRVDLAIDAILSSNKVQRLAISPDDDYNYDDDNNNNNNIDTSSNNNNMKPQQRKHHKKSIFSALANGLLNTKSLIELGFLSGPIIHKQSIQELCLGLQYNTTIVELNFYRTSFRNIMNNNNNDDDDDDDIITTLANGLQQLFFPTSSLSSSSSIQHLRFQQCGLLDHQVATIINALTYPPPPTATTTTNNNYYNFKNDFDNNIMKDFRRTSSSYIIKHNLRELSLDGNYCCSDALDALGLYLQSPYCNLVVLDLASQQQQPPTTITTINKPSSTRITKMNLEQFSKAFIIPPPSPNLYYNNYHHLTCLQLSDNKFHSESSLIQFFKALEEESFKSSLRILHFAFCTDFTKYVNALDCLGLMLTKNKTITKIVLYECQITNDGINKFCNHLPKMNNGTLKHLDFGGNQLFNDYYGRLQILKGLQDGNVVLEELILRNLRCSILSRSNTTNSTTTTTNNNNTNHHHHHYQLATDTNNDNIIIDVPLLSSTATTTTTTTSMPKSLLTISKEIAFYLDANRGGRRFLRYELLNDNNKNDNNNIVSINDCPQIGNDDISSSSLSSTSGTSSNRVSSYLLWPYVLERIQKRMEIFSSYTTSSWDPWKEEQQIALYEKQQEQRRRQQQQNSSLTYDTSSLTDDLLMLDEFHGFFLDTTNTTTTTNDNDDDDNNNNNNNDMNDNFSSITSSSPIKLKTQEEEWESIRRTSVLYHMLRNGNILFQQ